MDRKAREEVLALAGRALDERVEWEVFRRPSGLAPGHWQDSRAAVGALVARVREWDYQRRLRFCDYLGLALERRLGGGRVAAELRPLWLQPEDYARAAVLAALEG